MSKHIKKFNDIINTNKWITKHDPYKGNGRMKYPNDGKAKRYFVHDNGGIVFMVRVSPRMIKVYTFSTWINNMATYNKFILKIKPYIKLYVGYDNIKGKRDAFSKGNTILVKVTPNTYVQIGNRGILKFNIREDIIDYISPIFGSDIPYPLIMGENNMYEILSKAVISRDIHSKYDPYIERSNNVVEWLYKESKIKDFPKFRITTLIKRP